MLQRVIPLLLISASLAYADNQETLTEQSQAKARAVLDRAVDAIGGADALRAIESAKAMQSDKKSGQSGDRRERAERRNEVNARLRKVESEIESSEKRLAEIHAVQADPTSYSSGKITPELVAELKALETKLPKLMQEWESLGTEAAELKAR